MGGGPINWGPISGPVKKTYCRHLINGLLGMPSCLQWLLRLPPSQEDSIYLPLHLFLAVATLYSVCDHALDESPWGVALIFVGEISSGPWTSSWPLASPLGRLQQKLHGGDANDGGAAF